MAIDWNPCCHGMCAILDKGLNPDDYIHSYYRKNMFHEAYGKVMELLRDPKFWDKNNMHDPPVPPKLKKRKEDQKTEKEDSVGD